MRLTRKQKRWIRQHRGLINLIKLLVLVLIVCVAVFAFFWANVVDTSNDKVMNEKNGYILSENVR